MDDFFKYLTHSQEDENWGLYLNVAGSAKIQPGQEYPPIGHPSGYNFEWEKGRDLHEYQINYITEGEGIIETKQGIFPVKEGSVLIIYPHTWHRYKPLKEKGWKEHYIGFYGDMAERLGNNYGIYITNPVQQIGFHEKIINVFYDVFNQVKNEKPGYQQICSGMLIQILGMILYLKKNENFQNKRIETYIQKSCLKIRENVNKDICMQDLASEFDISYSLFRKEFKNYTGLSPVQYHLSLRIQQALYLLTNTDMNIKEIAFQLGFSSEYYFSRLFKDKTGKTPSECQHNVKKNSAGTKI